MINCFPNFCPFPDGSQLTHAVGFLQSHPGQIKFVTIDIGGNDWLGAEGTGCDPFDVSCVNSILPTIQANLTTILQALETAAPGVPIYGMSYYDPFLGFWLLGADGQLLAQRSEQAELVLNAGLVAAYQANGAEVADVAGAFAISDFADQVELKGVGLVPLNVANACTWTWFCTPPPLGPDIHPN